MQCHVTKNDESEAESASKKKKRISVGRLKRLRILNNLPVKVVKSLNGLRILLVIFQKDLKFQRRDLIWRLAVRRPALLPYGRRVALLL